MGLRIISFAAMTAVSFVLFVGDSAHATPKKVPSTGKPGAASPSKSAKPAPPAPPPVFKVCVRPEGVKDTVKRWTFGETFKPVVDDVERTAKLAGNRIFEFDEKANLDDHKRYFPRPYNQQKCPNDKREPAAPEPEKPQAPYAGIGSHTVLSSSTSPLAAGALGSSGTGKTTDKLVKQFVQDAAHFNLNGTQAEISATKFADTLRNSIVNKTTLPEFNTHQLDVDAATILADEFGENLAAAMAKQPVIGPAKVLQKMAPRGKNAGFVVFVLIRTDAMAGYELTPADELPAVILPLAEFQQRTSAANGLLKPRIDPQILHGYFQQLYSDKPAWLAAIAHFF